MAVQSSELRVQRPKTVVACVSALCILHSAFASVASAEIVIFKNGRTMSAKSYTVVGDMATLVLREGGEVTFPSSIVERVEADEVPYPAPAAVVNDVPQVIAAAPLVSDETLAARPFADLITAAAAEHDVDARLVHAVIEQESNYEARARSKKGARGLMQLMPVTARQYGVRNSYDPKSNIEAGVRHLKGLLSRLDLPAALAAYNEIGRASCRERV